MTDKERQLQDHLDLMVDEFVRIGNLAGESEIRQLCERGIGLTKQKVPVIEQRNRARAALENLQRAATGLRPYLAHYGACALRGDMGIAEGGINREYCTCGLVQIWERLESEYEERKRNG